MSPKPLWNKLFLRHRGLGTHRRNDMSEVEVGHPKRHVGHPAWAYGKRLDLHNAEAAAVTDLRGAHEELRHFRWHFQTTTRQAAVSFLRFHHPEVSKTSSYLGK